MLRTVPNTECSTHVSYYDSLLDSLNVPDTADTKESKLDLLIHSTNISWEAAMPHTEMGADDICPYPPEAQSLVREGGGHYASKQLKIHTSKAWSSPGREGMRCHNRNWGRQRSWVVRQGLSDI